MARNLGGLRGAYEDFERDVGKAWRKFIEDYDSIAPHLSERYPSMSDEVNELRDIANEAATRLETMDRVLGAMPARWKTYR